jgi:hypothetical protein
MDQERLEYVQGKIANAKRQLLPQWMRREKELPIVEFPVEFVRFSVLNHRTRAEQMKRRQETKMDDLFTADPLGEMAQTAQQQILMAQEGFDALKADLLERGQREPAVVTGDGILINGNRRAAALKSIWKDDEKPVGRYITAFVLPFDATPEEMIDLETELQVARDFKEDYSWVNEAFLVEEVFEAAGKDWERVSSRMRLTAEEARAQYDKLQLLHQLVSLSDGQKHYADFVANESAFEELAKHIKGKGGVEADAVRSVYFLGTIAGATYRDLRNLRRADAMDFVAAEITNDPTLSLLTADKLITQDQELSILDDVLGERTDAGREVDELLGLLVKRGDDEEIEVPGSTPVSVKQVLQSVKSVITTAAKEAEEDSRDTKAAVAPLKRLEEAVKAVERAKAALPRARNHPDWAEETFLDLITRLDAEIRSLEAIA